MGYIEEIRGLVGHRAIIMVGSAILITDDQGRLLMGKRADNNHWGIPGGSMEPGETVEETARREAKEETSLEVGEMRLFGVFSGPQFFYTYPNGDQVHNVSIVYESSDYRGQIEQVEEHTMFQFFAPAELPEEISPPVQPVIESWRAKQNQS